MSIARQAMIGIKARGNVREVVVELVVESDDELLEVVSDESSAHLGRALRVS